MRKNKTVEKESLNINSTRRNSLGMKVISEEELLKSVSGGNWDEPSGPYPWPAPTPLPITELPSPGPAPGDGPSPVLPTPWPEPHHPI